MTAVIVLRPVLLLLLLLVPGLYLAQRCWPPPLSRQRARLSLALRSLVVVLVVLALADVRVPRTPERRAVVAVVDLSDSTQAALDQASAAVRDLMAGRQGRDAFGVVTFGRDAVVEVPVGEAPHFDGFDTRPDGGYSDLAAGLMLAANIIPDGYARQLILVSDGRQNLGDAVQAVADLRERSVRVDVFGLGPAARVEAQVLSLDSPDEIRAGESLVVAARLRAVPAAGGDPAQVVSRGILRLGVNGRIVAEREVELAPGVTSQKFEIDPLAAGTHRLSVDLEAQPDSYGQNNRAEAVVKVSDQPRILMLEGARGEGANVARGMRAAGMQVEVRPATAAPGDVAQLGEYDAVVVAGAPAYDFSPAALTALATAVRDFGKGLVAIGSPDSYGPGGWGGTPLEEMLPVRMEVPRPMERPAVSVAIVIETMEDRFGDGVALGAIDSVIDALRPDDEIAVIGMQGPGPVTVSPMAAPVDKAALKQKVRSAVLGDPQNPAGYGLHLEAGIEAVRGSQAANRHVVILGDGDAVADIDSYEALFARTRAAGVTVTSVGVNTHHEASFMDHMALIASAGGGRFYLSDTAAQVPEILLDVSRSTLRPWYEQVPFFPTVTSAGGLLAGVSLDAFPELGGYVATIPKPASEVALSSPKGDPVLAAGRYGLGRTVAWTPDAEGRWTAGFLASAVSAELFGRMGAWVLASKDSGDVHVDALPRGDGLEVTVTAPAGAEEIEVRSVGPDQVATRHRLAPAGPGTWKGTIAAAEVGAHLLNAVVTRSASVIGTAQRTVVVPYSPEYAEHGRDDATLGELAALGGAVLGTTTGAWSLPLLPLAVTSPIFWALLLAVAVLWPLDVALRRLDVTPQRLLAALRRA